MAGKYLVQLVIAGVQVVGRAFSRALKEELAASQEAAKRRAASSNGSSSFSSNAQSAESDLRHGITLEEPVQILNVDKKLDPSDIESKYKHLFEVNDKSRGGSFYIQSKVVRAKERIDQELSKRKTEDSKTSEDS